MHWLSFSALALAASWTLLPAVGGAPAGPPRYWNTFRIASGGAMTDIEWVSPSTFRFSRSWSEQPLPKPITTEAVKVEVKDLGDRWNFETRYLVVNVSKTGSALTIGFGDTVLNTSVMLENGKAVIDDSPVKGERFYGLGARQDRNLDLRGRTIGTRRPFLLSSAGYGVNYRAAGTYRFDLASSKPDRRRVFVPAPRAEFCFYYGPEPKSIFEEHQKVHGAIPQMEVEEFQVRPSETPPGKGTWTNLREALCALEHAGLSGLLAPAFDLAPYQGVEPGLADTAAKVGAFLPVLAAANPAAGDRDAYDAMARERNRMIPYLLTYAYEARTSGIPIVRPLVMQFPEDPKAAARSDIFMVGDELLLAPGLNPEAPRRIYLPRGVWTGWRSNRTYRGREEILVDPAEGPAGVFVRNGTIVPAGASEADEPLELHYFPSLGAEFFLYEPREDYISQFHAAPAAGFLRFEAESLVERTYEWIAHHVDECAEIEIGGQPLKRVRQRAELTPDSWFYDNVRRQLHVRVRPGAHTDQIINISF